MFKPTYKNKIVIFIILCISLITAKTIDIPSDYSTIQEGINASVSGDTILVHPGTYFENLEIQGKNIILGSLFLTTLDTSYISKTIIDGNHLRSTISVNYNVSSAALISGFTVQNGGNTTPGGNSRGGGIYCDNASPRLSYLTVKNNSVNRFGGGIYLFQYNSSINNVIIKNNISAGDGGGIRATYSNFSISESVIFNNHSGGEGGAICVEFANKVIIDHLLIYKNKSDIDGGGVFINEVTETNIIQSTITENSIPSRRYGPGLVIQNIFSTANIINTIIYNNYNGTELQDIYQRSGQINLAYSCIGESFNGQNWVTEWSGVGNIYDYPNYQDLDEENYSLSVSSPCIEAGTNLYVSNGDTLINYQPNQYIGVAPDIGYYETPYFIVHPGDTDNNGIVEANDIIPIGIYFLNEGPHRNNANLAWNPQTTLMWDDVSITYADTNGDGIIDERDIIGIGVNWGNSHTMIYQNSSVSLSDNIIKEHRESFQKLYNSLKGDSEPIQSMKELLREILNIQIPLQFQLYNNYPNPFNSSTILKFDLPISEVVTIKIFNILGQEIFTPINEILYSEGTNFLKIDLNNLSGGIYYYQIKTESNTITKKMALVK